MDEVVIVDCGTGEAHRREMTPDEAVQRTNDVAEHTKHEQARQQETAAREGALATVASKVGLSADELKRAFGVGTPPASKTDPKKRRPQ